MPQAAWSSESPDGGVVATHETQPPRYARLGDLSEVSEPDAYRRQARRTHRAVPGLSGDLPRPWRARADRQRRAELLRWPRGCARPLRRLTPAPSATRRRALRRFAAPVRASARPLQRLAAALRPPRGAEAPQGLPRRAVRMSEASRAGRELSGACRASIQR